MPSPFLAAIVRMVTSTTAVAAAGAVALPSPPNLVLAFSDDTGWGDPSCFGNPSVVTPQLDRMAAEGMRLTAFYVAAPICSSSRASLLTGRIPLRTGVWSNKSTHLITFPVDSTGGLSLRERTLPMALRQVGYGKSLAIGKWHLGQLPQYLPTARGFDEYLGIPYCHNSCPCPSDQATIECYRPPGLPPQGGGLPCPLLNGTTVVQQPIKYADLTARYVAAATSFLREATAAQQQLSENYEDEHRPFFLYFAFGHTHAWNFASPSFWGTSERGHYGDALLEMDTALGNLTDIIRSATPTGAGAAAGWSSTFVFWTSDNGAAWPHRFEHAGSTGPFACGKGTVFEGGVRVPAIAWWPGVIEPGVVSMTPLSTLDVFPTMLRLATTHTLQHQHQQHKDVSHSTPVLDGIDLSEFFVSSGKTGTPGPRAFF